MFMKVVSFMNKCEKVRCKYRIGDAPFAHRTQSCGKKLASPALASRQEGARRCMRAGVPIAKFVSDQHVGV